MLKYMKMMTKQQYIASNNEKDCPSGSGSNSNSPNTDSYNFYAKHFSPSGTASVMDSDIPQVLDLSRRRDSVETRTTSSPCNTGSTISSPGINPSDPTASVISNDKIFHQNLKLPSVQENQPSSSLSPLHISPYLLSANGLQTAAHSKATLTVDIAQASSSSAPNSNCFPCRFGTNSSNITPNSLLSPPTEIVTSVRQSSLSPKRKLSHRANENYILLQGSKTDSMLHSPSIPQPTIPILYPTLLTVGENGKQTRPFKAYPRDPLVIAANFAATDGLYNNLCVERYTEYRKRVLEQISSVNGGHRTITNPKMRRTNGKNKSSTNDVKKNNAADENSIDCPENNNEENSVDNRFVGLSDNDTSSMNAKNLENGTKKSKLDESLEPANESLKQDTTEYCNNSNDSKNNNNNSSPENQNGIVKDAAYYERRRKNNAAAKKSRDRRRIKEDEISIRATFLERQNIELICQIDNLRAELIAARQCHRNCV